MGPDAGSSKGHSPPAAGTGSKCWQGRTSSAITGEQVLAHLESNICFSYKLNGSHIFSHHTHSAPNGHLLYVTFSSVCDFCDFGAISLPVFIFAMTWSKCKSQDDYSEPAVACLQSKYGYKERLTKSLGHAFCMCRFLVRLGGRLLKGGLQFHRFKHFFLPPIPY